MAANARPLRIQFVTTSLMLGGAEGQVFLLAAEAKRRGHEVSMVTMRDPEAFEDELRTLGIPLHSLAMRRGVGDPRALVRLARLVRAERPDVVHSHMVHANLLARLTRLLAPMPVQISTAHNLTEGARWREIAYRLTDPLCDLTTNVCHECVERYVASGAAPRGRIRYMANGLDVARFDPRPGRREAKRRELGIDPDTFLWLAVGRLEEQKDYPNMVAAVKHLVEDAGCARRRLAVLVAGSGDQRSRLEQQVEAAGLAATVTFLGDRADVPDLMAAADAYLMSSAWEGMPMVLLEAGAARLPAVVTDVGGNDEVVSDGASGYVVPPHDSAALGAAMQRLMSLELPELARFGAELRRHVETTFGLGAVADRWEALYRELLARKGRA
ncbi:MAG: glycosyltransferase [Trueperaceae bacterium]|nr:glycosyltransferase [Trueperaceae bacterium]